jgi:hypothetical protein
MHLPLNSREPAGQVLKYLVVRPSQNARLRIVAEDSCAAMARLATRPTCG